MTREEATAAAIQSALANGCNCNVETITSVADDDNWAVQILHDPWCELLRRAGRT